MNIGKTNFIITLCALAPLTVWAGESIDQSWSVDERVRISVENTVGEIEIQGWDKNEVHLTGRLGEIRN